MPGSMQTDTRDRFSIARQWIKANVLGATGNAIAGVLVYGLLRVPGATGGEAAAPVLTVVFLLAVAVTIAAFSLYGFLLAVVLRQKVFAFPMQHWLLLYVMFGAVLGVLTAYPELSASDASAPAAQDDTMRGIVVGGILGGALIGAAVGALQALVLRHAARGLGLWIRYSALSGTTMMLVVAVSLLAPEVNFGNELLGEVATFAAAVISAFLMLPALEHLEPQ